ncbi:MAG: oxygen-independent coproporphyrinogen III oxidase [Bacteroidota bacterium]|nr:oxygen-independent coproporphyrinogen III oxidase [Bacteroidota bacterium]
MIERELLEKYNKAVPRYTSYPPANFFYEDFNGDDYKKFLISSNHDKPENISLYIHIPFCPRLCYYCGCNTTITKNNAIINSYIEALKKEIIMVSGYLADYRKVSQIHWGGGTPNALDVDIVKSIMDLIFEKFQLIPNAEIAMECSPAYLTKEYLDALFAMKFNRISLGIQDFKKDVLKAVNRASPAMPVKVIMDYIRENSDAGINLDFIYGLPLQNTESFGETMGRAVELQPDRLVTFSYAHVPWIKKSQQKLEDYGLPAAELKLKMFETGYEIMTTAGYIPIGLDHYAKAEDDLSKALKNKSLHRNFQGYCTRQTTGQVYAFGTSAISQLYSSYAQNTKDVKDYVKRIKDEQLPIDKGYKLGVDQIIIREIINEIMCNQYLSLRALAERLNIDLDAIKTFIPDNHKDLEVFEEDGLIDVFDDGIRVIGDGRFVIRNIAAAYDPILKTEQKNFSKSI